MNGCAGSRPGLDAPQAEGSDSLDGECCAGKAVVIGIGNRYLRDDAIGIEVAEELAHHKLKENILVRSCQAADLALLAQFTGATKIVLVDAFRSGALPGTVSRYAILPSRGSLDSIPGLHSLELLDMFDIATQSGLLTCPVTIIGVEPKDTSPGEGLSPELARAVPKVLSAVVELIRSS